MSNIPLRIGIVSRTGFKAVIAAVIAVAVSISAGAIQNVTVSRGIPISTRTTAGAYAFSTGLQTYNSTVIVTENSIAFKWIAGATSKITIATMDLEVSGFGTSDITHIAQNESPTMVYTGDVLTRVNYVTGAYKILEYNADTLKRIDFVTPQGTTRKTFLYSVDGNLLQVIEGAI